MAFSDYFSVQVFFLLFREALETAVIVSVLLSFLKQGFGSIDNLSPQRKRMYNALRRQVWLGAVAGVLVCIVIGAIFLIAFHLLGTNLWDKTEKLWEAFFCILASIIITVMGMGMLRINKLRSKWKMKLARAILDAETDASPDSEVAPLVNPSIPADVAVRMHKRRHSLRKKFALAFLPFITTLREGLEAVAFLGGLGASQPSSSFPLAVLAALGLGSAVGWVMYRYGSGMSIKVFLIISTCFLYLVAAGLFSRGIWFLEADQFIRRVGSDVTELGSGPGSYDISHSVWHVNCCNPETDGLWMLFNGILGWQNSATYFSVMSYNLYWVAVILMILRFHRLEREGKGKHGGIDEDLALIRRASSAIAYTDDPESVTEH